MKENDFTAAENLTRVTVAGEQLGMLTQINTETKHGAEVGAHIERAKFEIFAAIKLLKSKLAIEQDHHELDDEEDEGGGVDPLNR